jgi:hypothetical protein
VNQLKECTIARPVELPVLPDGLNATRLELPPVPSRAVLAMPWPLRLLLEKAGLVVEARPLIPSAHLEQTRRLINEWGWCKSMDLSPTGRLCIRGAQGVLERAGYVTRDTRKTAEGYMQKELAKAGVRMEFFAWNDLPGTTRQQVDSLLRASGRRAYEEGR